ncbi:MULTISPECIES: DUF6275 family protein [Ligilactobacillus]|jgi:hypothetical protein|uniref:Phage protein n=1 Tax=Ligilactobacillus animalis TaxID=1605 RepID=A0ABR4RQ16_9LACO|nr:DUF6275 family protein [Ligilactobacillus animalis]KDA46169.1 hypothetical protein Lani381_0853 [Ligilactobacillus animalis]MDU1488356.1 DUF6275 family protein [Ligilactobacillus animalis]MEE0260838.1 DUF6275 family protein [Ligilactobacillus animalis]PNQ52975.1 hypothetical protein C0L91_02245 [Ligilactobacillus animalis]
MDGRKFLDLCVEKLLDIVNDYNRFDNTDADDVFIVWSCKTLQHNKALLGVDGSDEYYEFTYNGDKKELYVDVYSKADQHVFEESQL